MRQHNLFHTPEELGRLARQGREAQNLALRTAAPQANVGPRFLSEFERGKPTAELGKVISAVNAAGLDLAVVKRAANSFNTNKSEPYSKRLNTEFPYDWSNRQMNEAVFIRSVLKASRFNDVLKVVAYFGFDAVSNELPCLKDAMAKDKVISILLRIHKGKLLSRCLQHSSNNEPGNKPKK